MEVTDINALISEIKSPSEFEKGYIAGRQFKAIQGRFVHTEPTGLSEISGKVKFPLTYESVDVVGPEMQKYSFRGAYRDVQRTLIAPVVFKAIIEHKFSKIKGSCVSVDIDVYNNELIADFTVKYKKRTVIPFFPRAQEQVDRAYQRTDRLSYEEVIYYLLAVDAHLTAHQIDGWFGCLHEFFFKFVEYEQVRIFRRPKIIVEFVNRENDNDTTIIRKVAKGQFREVRHHYERIDNAVRKRVYDEEVDEERDKLYYLTHVKHRIFRLTSMRNFNSLLVWVVEMDIF